VIPLEKRLQAIRERHLGISIVENGLDVVLTWDLKPGLSLTIIDGGKVDFTFIDYSTAYWSAAEQETFGELVAIADERSPMSHFMKTALMLTHEHPRSRFTGRISNFDTYGRLVDYSNGEANLVVSLEKDGWVKTSPMFAMYLTIPFVPE
jgi:hypothetical protein